MKVLLLIPSKYSLHRIFERIFSISNAEVVSLDYRETITGISSQINVQAFRLPHLIRNKWINYYLTRINNWYIKQFSAIKPDIVFVYNNEMLLPETLGWLKEKNTPIAFFLGDNPLYTHTSPYNLAVLEYADAVFVPDTFWQFQLQKMGLRKVHHMLFPLPDDEYYPINTQTIGSSFKLQHQADVFYAGMCYNDSWGYKKAKFLNHFTQFDLKIYGNKAWEKWTPFFPELNKHITFQKSYIPTSDLNKIYNLSKIIPVDGNPGIFNGLHLRAIEAISSGVLPLMEYNKDIDYIFEGVDNLPAVKSYNEIFDMVSFYLKNEDKRIQKVLQMKEVFKKKFSAEIVGKKILGYIS